MHPQVAAVRELLAAVLTLVRLDAHVTEHVRVELGGARERVSAQLALAAPSRHVRVGVAHVLLHGVHVRELFAARRTLEEVLRAPRDACDRTGGGVNVNTVTSDHLLVAASFRYTHPSFEHGTITVIPIIRAV